MLNEIPSVEPTPDELWDAYQRADRTATELGRDRRAAYHELICGDDDAWATFVARRNAEEAAWVAADAAYAKWHAALSGSPVQSVS